MQERVEPKLRSLLHRSSIPLFQCSRFRFQGLGFRLRGTQARQRRLNGAIAIERLERLERSKLKEN